MGGFTLNPSQEIDRVGMIQWDGTGGLTLNQIQNVAGVPQPSSNLSGTYSVSSNGRVTATVNNLSLSPNDFVFYLVSENDAYILQNDPGVEITGFMNQLQ